MMILNPYAFGGGAGDHFEDTFDVDSIASYTASGGNWAIAGGQLSATPPTLESILTRNGYSALNTAVEFDSNQAYDAGLVLRVQSSLTYYMLAVRDDSGSAPASNLMMYRRGNGPFIGIGSSVNITWPRGSSRTIRFQINGSTLKVFVNGVEVISETDANIATAGGVGMRSDTSVVSNLYQAFRWGYP
jgi:mannan endo-1,4-beta-mannosidase